MRPPLKWIALKICMTSLITTTTTRACSSQVEEPRDDIVSALPGRETEVSSSMLALTVSEIKITLILTLILHPDLFPSLSNAHHFQPIPFNPYPYPSSLSLTHRTLQELELAEESTALCHDNDTYGNPGMWHDNDT